MIKSITVFNYLGESLTLELAAPEKSGLWVKSIDGIGSGKSTINVTNMASNDGGVFNSARAETRNINISLGMFDVKIGDGDWTIEKSRQETYKYFPKKRWVKLIFKTDNRSLYIEGYVESNEPDIFSKEESVSISIICPDPNFYEDGGGHVDTLAEVEDNFEFPGVPPIKNVTGYSNESLSEDLTEFGIISIDVSTTVINYKGDIETGCLFRIKCRGHVENLSLYNAVTGESMIIDDSKLDSTLLPGGLSDGDIVEICTIKGSKSASVIREGSKHNILNSLGMNPNWFQIYPDDNVFAFTTTSGSGNVEIEILYEEAYEGV